MLTTRPEGGDRRISVSETRDWESFTTPELALQCDPLDAPLTQIYGMPVIPYEGTYIGLVWLFHCIPEPPNKYLGATWTSSWPIASTAGTSSAAPGAVHSQRRARPA